MGFYEHAADKKGYFNIGVRVGKMNETKAHFHNSLEIYVVLRGEIEVTINSVKRVIKAGEACISNSFDVHYYNKTNDDNYLAKVIMVNKSYLSSFDDNIGNFVTLSSSALDFIEKLTTEYKSDSTLMRTAKILYLLALISDNPENLTQKAPKSDIVTEILTYIHENFTDKITVQSIADKFGYSRGYVSTLFSSYTGERFNSYVNRLRVSSAKKMLDKKGSDKVLDIALANGFDSANTFYRAYKKEYGKPPVRIFD